ncbi:hypothetical protein [Polymorphospora lycopeni]|uniref:LPXTG cell wall anchor domain-containing protein n=1 Tax=Polymorphospora lycopeni TaxID=3140240 RepID=A0ABV5CR20_9ACTN
MSDTRPLFHRAGAAMLLLAGLVAGAASAASAAPGSPPGAPADPTPGGTADTATTDTAPPAGTAGTATAVASGSADLSVTARGLTVTNPVKRKIATLKVTNHGPATATGIRLRLVGWVDGESTDAGEITWCDRPGPVTSPMPTIPPGHRLVPVGTECDLPDLGPGRSLTLDMAFPIFGGGVIATFGEFTTYVWHGGTDPVPANNSVFSRLTGSDAVVGADLYALARDVPADASGRVGTVVPGGRGDLRFEIGNQGRTVVREIELTVRLPEHVSFEGDVSGCDYGAGRREATCVYRGLSLIPAKDDTDPNDDRYSGLRFRFPVRVAKSAPAPAHLPGGRLEVRALVDEETSRNVPAELPQQASPVRADPEAAPDRDPSDNTDTFTVFTAVDSGGGGGLPVTGGNTALLTRAGAGVVLVGATLLVLTRRRRHGTRTTPLA